MLNRPFNKNVSKWVERVPRSDEYIVTASLLKEFCVNILNKLDVPRDEARITAEVLVLADLRGIESHGVSRLPRYAKRLMNGWMRSKAKMIIKRETPISISIDAENSIGQVVAQKTMERCIEKAKKSYISFASVANSNHFGIAGYYAMMALQHNMIGICMSNAWPLVVPTLGITPILGTNPMAVAIPSLKEPAFVLDMASSVVPIGKMEVYKRHKKAVPSGWAIDEKGSPALDAETVMRCVYKSNRGGLLPLGGFEETAGYKGYGLAMLIDILSGILPAASFGPHVGSPEDPRPSNIGHFMGVIDIDAFTPVDEFKERMDTLIQTVKESAKADGQNRIFIHGEKEFELEHEYKKKGIPLYYKVWENLKNLADEVGVEFTL